MNHYKNSLIIALFLGTLQFSNAQNLDSLMSAAKGKQTEYATATFKGTRIINGHSIESPNKGVLQVMFSHRFGPLNDPLYTFLGLTQASIRFGGDYGITDRLAVGLGRSSGLGGTTPPPTYDVYAKYKVLLQSSGEINMPVTVSVLLASAINTTKLPHTDGSSYNFQDRLYYTAQILIAKKFSDRFSLQLMPTILHRNFTDSPDQQNTLYTLGIAGRIKLSKRVAITGEYYASLPNTLGVGYYNPLALGFEIETGGHVFQIHITNTQGLVENQFIGQTTANIFTGDNSNGNAFYNAMTALRIGFNFSRVFTIVNYNKK